MLLRLNSTAECIIYFRVFNPYRVSSQKYSVNQHLTETILSWVKSGEIAIPEIQRPFVWSSSKVRDLIDSLYQGYPVGYIIAWRNPNVKLKDGSLSQGKRVLIDGQQRVTALRAALLGQQIVTKEYSTQRITIAFNPQADEGVGKFEVQNPAILKDPAWIPDISLLFGDNISPFKTLSAYMAANPQADSDVVEANLNTLFNLVKKQIGLIELESDLSIEQVTEIFIRINAQGVVLSQADFAMSKIAASEQYEGPMLRKAIDYFCHLAVEPGFYDVIKNNDRAFAEGPYLKQIAWLRNENDDLYDPSYVDMLRVAFTCRFDRGRLADLVSLLSGRNFAERSYDAAIAEESFGKLRAGIEDFINETHFKRFLMIIKSAGFVVRSLVTSGASLNFAYILYLTLRRQGMEASLIERSVRRWFVMSLLTSRYSTSQESDIDYDIKQIHSQGIEEYLKMVEETDLSETFWRLELPQNLNSSSSNNPSFKVFLAAQVKAGDLGFLSSDITVQSLLEHRGDIHHLFPKEYLKGEGYSRGRYNSVANLAFMQTEINIKVGKLSPARYMGKVHDQIAAGRATLGGITTEEELSRNLRMHCIPKGFSELASDDYEDFLTERRMLIADKLRRYFQKL